MTFSSDENFALQLDREDPLRDFREKFSLPLGKDGKPVIYFAGNSLGLMPKSARQIVDDELDNWAKLGVDAHHATGTPWYSYHEALREPTARLVGANSARSDLHEQPHGEPSPDDGDVLSANQIALQSPDGRAGVPFRYLRD